MANNKENYRTFSWSNQLINDILVNTVTVRIFKPIDTVPSDAYNQLIATDGQTQKKLHLSPHKHTSDYSYVILSTGIIERDNAWQQPMNILFIKLYGTKDFVPSALKNLEFVGKSYLLEALGKLENFTFEPAPKPNSASLLQYLNKKIGAESPAVYELLKTSGQAYDIEKVEQLFKSYHISDKYQAVFWKELYQNTAKKDQK